MLESEKVTCYSCTHSIGNSIPEMGLWCVMLSHAADKICPAYMREMGADEPELEDKAGCLE